MRSPALGMRSPTLGALLLLLVSFVLMVLSSRHKRLSNDEWFNLEYGQSFLEEGSGLKPSPHLPSLALNAFACRHPACDRVMLDRDGGRRLLVRAPSILFALLLGFLTFAWTRELLGPRAALLALTLYVFNPNFLAHGKEVTGDAATSFFTLLAAYGAWRGTRGGVAGVFLSAVGLAGAALSKYTSLVLIPLLALALLFSKREVGPRKLVLGALGALLVFLFFLGAVYGFDGCFDLMKDCRFESRVLQRWGGFPIPLLLPRSYVLGFDFLLVFQEQPSLQRGMNYALGHLSWEPLWYAFPLMFLLKTPLGFFGLGIVAVLRRKVPYSPFLLFPCAGILILFALFVGPQMGVRYLLPAFPFLMIAAAAGVVGPLARSSAVAVALLTSWNVVSTLSYHPHYMCYFNELIGSRLHAYRFLADSNLDWEDRAYFIAEFQHTHPDLQVAVDPPEPRSGYVLVSANKLVGILDRQRYRWLRRHFEPIGHVGYSYLLFHVTEEDLQKALRDRPGGGG